MEKHAVLKLNAFLAGVNLMFYLRDKDAVSLVLFLVCSGLVAWQMLGPGDNGTANETDESHKPTPEATK